MIDPDSHDTVRAYATGRGAPPPTAMGGASLFPLSPSEQLRLLLLFVRADTSKEGRLDMMVRHHPTRPLGHTAWQQPQRAVYYCHV